MHIIVFSDSNCRIDCWTLRARISSSWWHQRQYHKPSDQKGCGERGRQELCVKFNVVEHSITPPPELTEQWLGDPNVLSAFEVVRRRCRSSDAILPKYFEPQMPKRVLQRSRLLDGEKCGSKWYCRSRTRPPTESNKAPTIDTK
jgi:hypothetical protein